MVRWLCLGWSLVVGVAQAGQLAGVTLPDSATVGGRAVVLNGMGLREKYYFDIYVGGLYLPARTTSATEAMADVPRRIVLHFVYNEVTKDQLVEAFSEGLAAQPNAAAVRDRFTTMYGMLDTVHAGDQIVLDYAPGAGTTVSVRGSARGTIPGADFGAALAGVFVGAAPPTAKLKRGLLGGT
jgi:hypothetical protein